MQPPFHWSKATATPRAIAWLFALWLTCGALWAVEVMPPKPAHYFNDYAHVVNAATAQKLDKQLEDFEKATSSQIVVAVFPKMQSDSSLEDYANRIFNAWQVGQKEKKNGAILFAFIQDRRMRIEVGYGLEGALPDAIAKRIIEDEVKPRFRNNDYAGGLAAGVNAMLQATRGEYKGTGKTVAKNRKSSGFPFWFLIIFILIIARVFSAARRGTVFSGRRGYRSSGWSWGGGNWSSGGGGWSSGGGGGGFSGGGGSSGGGGASGSW